MRAALGYRYDMVTGRIGRPTHKIAVLIAPTIFFAHLAAAYITDAVIAAYNLIKRYAIAWSGT